MQNTYVTQQLLIAMFPSAYFHAKFGISHKNKVGWKHQEVYKF